MYGHLQDARDDLAAALAKAEQSGDAELIAASSGALGNLAFLSRRSAVAEPLLTRSRDLARHIGNSEISSTSANDLGNLYAAGDRFGEATAFYDEAIASADAAHDAPSAATAEINAARLGLRGNDVSRAAALLTRAVDRLERLPPSYDGGMALIAAGVAISEYEGAHSPAAEAIASRALGAAVATAEATHSGIARFRSARQSGAARRAARTARRGRAADQPSPVRRPAGSCARVSARWEWQQARLLRRQGQIDPALASYRRAVADLQSVRQYIPVEYRGGHSSYYTAYGPLLPLEFTDLLLRRTSGDPRQQRRGPEVRDTVEQLKEPELQDYFRRTLITSFEAKRRSIDTIAPGTAVLYPIVLPDRTRAAGQLWRRSRAGSRSQSAQRSCASRCWHFVSCSRSGRQMNISCRLASVRAHHAPSEPGADPAPDRHPGHRPRQCIAADPVRRPLRRRTLRRRALCRRDRTEPAPGRPQTADRAAREALALGVSKSLQGFSGLPNVVHEVAAVRDMEGGKSLLNDEFSRARFKSELEIQPYNLVHIASHAEFGRDPSRTFVLAFDGRLTMDDLERDIKYGKYRESALELLTLSACETAAGDDRAALGLAGIALKSGARSALATLWSVNDRSTGELVLSFYRAIQNENLSKAHALQAAQREMLQDPVFGHPSYWAPFLLIGNWL